MEARLIRISKSFLQQKVINFIEDYFLPNKKNILPEMGKRETGRQILTDFNCLSLFLCAGII